MEEASVAAAEAAVAILDIPVKKNSRSPRKISTHDAEQILDSVLDALPEPKQPGQGRSRVSRRVSSPVITTKGAGSDSRPASRRFSATRIPGSDHEPGISLSGRDRVAIARARVLRCRYRQELDFSRWGSGSRGSSAHALKAGKSIDDVVLRESSGSRA